MAFPYSSGDVLTAADLNQSSGLVLVKTQTIGTGVSSVTVTGAFSSTFDNYRITVSGGACSAPASLRLQLGASTTGYYQVLLYYVYATGVGSVLTVNNGSNWTYCGEGNTSYLTVDTTLQNPNLAKQTTVSNFYPGTVAGFAAGYHSAATAYTAFTLSAGGGTMTGGTIRVYGYNNG